MLLLAALLQVGAATAAQPTPCPVTVKFVTVRPSLRRFEPIRVTAGFHNEGDKQIVAAKFQFIYLDATYDEHPAYATYTSDRNVFPRKDNVDTWTDQLLQRGMFEGGSKVQLLKVVYKDGTVWEAPSDDACVQKFSN